MTASNGLLELDAAIYAGDSVMHGKSPVLIPSKKALLAWIVGFKKGTGIAASLCQPRLNHLGIGHPKTRHVPATRRTAPKANASAKLS